MNRNSRRYLQIEFNFLYVELDEARETPTLLSSKNRDGVKPFIMA